MIMDDIRKEILGSYVAIRGLCITVSKLRLGPYISERVGSQQMIEVMMELAVRMNDVRCRENK